MTPPFLAMMMARRGRRVGTTHEQLEKLPAGGVYFVVSGREVAYTKDALQRLGRGGDGTQVRVYQDSESLLGLETETTDIDHGVYESLHYEEAVNLQHRLESMH